MAQQTQTSPFSFEELNAEVLQGLSPEQRKELEGLLSASSMQKMMHEGAGPEILKVSTDLLGKLYKDKCNIRQALGIPEKACDVLYACAHQKYSQGQYEEAVPMFRLLCLLDSHAFKYAYGLAAALQMQQELVQAATCYIYASHLDITNPMANFHAAECYLLLEDYVSAGVSLGILLNNSHIAPQYAQVKEKAQIMNQALQDKITKQVLQGIKED